jgi:hypothetical protein
VHIEVDPHSLAAQPQLLHALGEALATVQLAVGRGGMAACAAAGEPVMSDALELLTVRWTMSLAGQSFGMTQLAADISRAAAAYCSTDLAAIPQPASPP